MRVGYEGFFEQIDYDALGRILKTTGAMGQIWQFTHDEEDNLDSITDPLSLQISHSFDALNRLTDTVDRAVRTTSSDYNEADQLTTYTDPRSIDTDFAYNGFGELLTETSEDRGTINYTYNNRGLVSSMTDARGTVSTYEYDNSGRLTAHGFPSSPTEDQVFTYDIIRANGANIAGIGKIGKVVEESGWTSTFYLQNGTPWGETHKIEGMYYTVTHIYDADGNLTSSTTPSNLEVLYTYDAADQLNKIRQRRYEIDPQTGQYPPFEDVIKGSAYQPFGPAYWTKFGNDQTLTITYDQSYRATKYLDTFAQTTLRDVRHNYTLRDNMGYSYNALDNNETRNSGYNSRELLTSADGPWGNIDYTYDSVGNRLSRLLNGSTDSYTYPATKNRLQSVAGSNPRVLTYDAVGNVTIDQRGADTYVYAYNAANRMESVMLNGVLQAEYVYNAMGQQVIRRVNGQTIHSLHDLDGNRIAEYDYNPTTQISTLLREYIWMNGLPVS
jgi:YD repeat-containing protein